MSFISNYIYPIVRESLPKFNELKLSTESTYDDKEFEKGNHIKDDVQSTRSPNQYDLLSPSVCSILDRFEITDKTFELLSKAILEDLKAKCTSLLCFDDFKSSASTIRRKRDENRNKFNFDGKCLKNDINLPGKNLVVYVTGDNVLKEINPLVLEDGLLSTTTPVIKKAFNGWNLGGRIVAICTDTTEINSDALNGLCVQMERDLKDSILFLFCRHHILELILTKIFSEIEDLKAKPDMTIFKKFRDTHWSEINSSSFSVSLPSYRFSKLVESSKKFMLQLIEMNLHPNFYHCGDYVEFLHLCKKLLNPSYDYVFKPPGAYHRACWMVKVIYLIKIYLFRDQLKNKLKNCNFTQIETILVFVIKIYLRMWFESPITTYAPYNDFKLLKLIAEFKEIDKTVAKLAFEGIKGQLWYLSPKLVPLSFFDPRISPTEKDQLKKTMFNTSFNRFYGSNVNRIELSLKEIKNLEFINFFSKDCSKFFEILEIDHSFLEQDAVLWTQNESYEIALSKIRMLNVTNNRFERCIYELSKKITSR